jgi:hypothetical protein
VRGVSRPTNGNRKSNDSPDLAVAFRALAMHARFLAATKATNGVLSHYSAATLWRLVDYDPNTPVHVTVSTRGTRRVPGVVVHRTRREYQVIRLDSIAVVTPARALIDLSSMTEQLDEVLAEGYVPAPSSTTPLSPVRTTPPNRLGSRLTATASSASPGTRS